MNRAIVIKTAGDPEIAGAIVDGITKKVIPLDADELATVKAECARLKARDGVRRSKEDDEWPAIRDGMAVKFGCKTHGPVYNNILLAWAIMWLVIFECFRRLQAWNRET